jgi:predicted CopG family antitoxin
MLFFSSVYTQSFSDSDLKTFTVVYFELKKKQSANKSMNDLISQYPEITKERYGELLRGAFNGDDLNLTKQEASFIKDIQKIKSQDLANKLDVEKETCADHHLSYSTYKEMLQQYKSNHHFQNDLKPYFTKYLNQ